MLSCNIVRATREDEPRIVEFLRQHAYTSLFLLSNLKAHGPSLGADRNSGNYKIIVENAVMHGVFCLTRRGNLLLQTDKTVNFCDAILEECIREELPLSGVIGEAQLCHQFLDTLGVAGKIRKVLRATKERLYRRDLCIDDTQIETAAATRLQASDFNQWLALIDELYSESFIPPRTAGSEEEETAFLRLVRSGIVWGAHVDGCLASIANLNVVFEDIGQVAGVYTAKALRRRGLNTAVLRRMFSDSFSHLSLRELVLFTGEHQVAAWTLYESLGFKRHGDFGMLFFELIPSL